MNTLDARRRLLGRNVYKKTVEGNPAIAQGSLARRYPGITMQGWTEQEETTGAQLFDISNIKTYLGADITEKSEAYTVDGNSVVVTDNVANCLPGINIPIDATQENIFVAYTTNSTRKYIYFAFVYTDGTKSAQVYYNSNSHVIPLVPDEGKTIQSINLGIGDFRVNESYTLSEIMVNYGSEALPWEPYTGGVPSPSPDYPQEIVSAGKYNEGTGKWEYEVDISTNLIPGTYRQVEQNSVVFTMDNGKITVIGNGNANRRVLKTNAFELKQGHYTLNIGKVLGFAVFMSDETNGAIGNIPKGSTTLEFDISDTIMASVGVTTAAGNEFNEEFYPMLVMGSEPLPYEPYKPPQTLTLTSDRPLTKWDRLEKRNGQWGWVYKSNTVTLDGSEDEKWAFDAYVTNKYTIKLSDDIIGKNTFGYCNHFIFGLPYEVDRIGINVNAMLWIAINWASSDLTLWKNYLSQNPITVIYPTSEETFVPLSASEQEQMNALYTFRPTTVLSNDAGCNMELTYKTKKSLEVTD